MNISKALIRIAEHIESEDKAEHDALEKAASALFETSGSLEMLFGALEKLAKRYIEVDGKEAWFVRKWCNEIGESADSVDALGVSVDQLNKGEESKSEKVISKSLDDLNLTRKLNSIAEQIKTIGRNREFEKNANEVLNLIDRVVGNYKEAKFALHRRGLPPP